LCTYALFGVRSWKGLLRWWGIPFLIVDLIGVAGALTTLPLLNWAFATYVAGRVRETLLAPNMAQTLFDLARHVAQNFATWVAVEAEILGVLGLAMIVGSFSVKPKQAYPS
jgi:hypothetical protein